jgi:YHS domain-containing protein
MKHISQFTCLAALGVALAATPSLASAETMSGGCCGAAMPMSDAPKTDSKAKPYPLDTCIVSGEKLGEMGAPFVFTYEGQEIKLCCKSCKKKFDKSPETYLKKLSEAPAKK